MPLRILTLNVIELNLFSMVDLIRKLKCAKLSTCSEYSNKHSFQSSQPISEIVHLSFKNVSIQHTCM